MTPLRIALAIIFGFMAGSAVNMGLVLVSGHLIPPPPGIDLADPVALKAALPLLGPQYFLFPFLSHALGTLVGALLACLFAPAGKEWTAWVIGLMFLAGGIAAAVMIPAPAWFLFVDLALAYIPMAWLGIRIGETLSRKSATF